MIIQLIYRELSCKEMYNVWSVTCWSALTESDKFDLYLSERCRMWEQERRGGGGDIRRTASKEWAGQEVRPGITLAAGRVSVSPVRRGEIQSTAPPRVYPLGPVSPFRVLQPLAQFQTSLAKQLTVGRESLTSLSTLRTLRLASHNKNNTFLLRRIIPPC